MATKPTFPKVTNTGNVTAQLNTINLAITQIESEFEKMLSREDESLPNHMLDALDMDGNKVINVADGTEGADAVNKSQLDTKEDGLGNPYEDGMFLASLTNGHRYWSKTASGGSAPVPLTVFEYIDFNTANTATNAVGRIRWNDTDGTLDVGLKGGNVTMQVGQEQFIRVVNKTGANLLEANYQCVKISGAQGQRPKIGLALADNDLNSADTIGLVTETILNNQEGFVTTSGQVRGINTTGSLQGETWADGDLLYLSGTTAGQITNIKPVAPTHTVIVGYVIHAHANNGIIFVKVDNGYELDELHNVKITTPTNNQVLQYTSATGLWENKTLAAGGSGTVTSVSVVSANGFAGTVANETTTPAITLSTSITGLLKGNGTAISSAVSGTDYVPPAGTGATGTWGISVSGNAATVTNGVYTTGNQTIGGTKTFSSTISGSIDGNAATVTNGVYTTGNQTISGNKTFSGTTALAVGSTIDSIVIGYRDVPTTISNAAKTFALADAGKAFGKDNGTAYTYTIPANSSVAFPVGTVITVFNNNATNNITIAINTDTLRLAGTTTTGSRTVAPFGLCTLYKASSTVWFASGAGVT